MKKELLTLFLVCFSFPLFAQLVINEVCSDNEDIIADQYGDYSDWIELFNNSNVPIDLEGYFLSDDPDDLYKWEFPAIVIDANSLLLIFASDEDDFENELHTNFKLSKSGEPLFLLNSNNTIIDQIEIPELKENHSYGRSTNNIGIWQYYSVASPGTANEESSSYGYNTKPVFVTQDVFNNTPTYITLACNSPSCFIRYTLDGSLPTENSNLYTSPLLMDSTVCIRAQSFSNDLLPSAVETKTYFIQAPDHELPVLSLVTEPHLLWDWEDGIFVSGPDADTVYPYYGSNFWDNIVIPLHLEYFKEDKLLANYNIGTKVHGGKGARTKPMKSLRFIADKDYGVEEMDFSFFEERENNSYKRLVLRNASGDFNYTHFRDAYLQRYFIKEDLHVDVLAYQPVATYLNGKYWGVMNLREKVDKYYLNDNHGIDIDQVDLLEEDAIVIEGGFDVFDGMYDFVLNSDLTNEANFDIVDSNFDLENIADYVIGQTTVNNTDWPNNNIKYWRERKVGAKWRYLLFDMDVAMGRGSWTEADKDTFKRLMSSESIVNNKFVKLFKALMQNENFKIYFLNRYADLLNTTFLPDKMIAELDLTVEAIDEEMFRHFQNWTWPGYEVWENDRLPGLYEFSIQRPAYARQYLIDFYNLENEVNLKLSVFPPDAGQIKINTITPEVLPWEGSYFNHVPITLTVEPNPGYSFEYWESIHTIKEANSLPQIKSVFAEDDEITAFFEADKQPLKVYISPNPIGSTAKVQFLLDQVSPVTITIFDVQGKQLKTFDLGRLNAGYQQLEIEAFDFSSGLYIIEVNTPYSSAVEKFIK